ncbi:Receptor-interacting serine/threonine-protein kinase 4, partial [Symbiodinium microadriaticum]
MASRQPNSDLLLECVCRKNLECQSVDNTGRNALHVACSFGSADAVQMLLAKGIEAGLQDDHGLLPLHYAIDSRSVPCVQAVLQ